MDDESRLPGTVQETPAAVGRNHAGPASASRPLANEVIVVELWTGWLKIAAALLVSALLKSSKVVILDRPSDFDWFRAGFALVSWVIMAVVLFRERKHYFEIDRWEVRELRGSRLLKRAPLQLVRRVKRGWTGVQAEFSGGVKVRFPRGWTNLEDATEALEIALDEHRRRGGTGNSRNARARG